MVVVVVVVHLQSSVAGHEPKAFRVPHGAHSVQHCVDQIPEVPHHVQIVVLILRFSRAQRGRKGGDRLVTVR